MTGFSALYFPDTLPPAPLVAGLTALLGPLACYQPLADAPLPPPWSELAAAGYLQLRRPQLPEPQMAQRLQALLKELDDQRGEAAGLFARNLAAAFSADRAETSPEVAGALRGQNPAPASLRAQQDTWQALLLLKLNENLEGRELELESALREIEQGRSRLLHQLRGEEKESPPNPPPGNHPSRPLVPQRPWRHPDRLLRAWSRLFLADPQGADLLVTADRESWNLLLEPANSGGNRPVPLARLLLPTSESPPEQNRQEIAAELRAALQKAAATGNPEEVAATTSTWNQAQTATGADCAGSLEIMLVPRSPADLPAAINPAADPAATGNQARPQHRLLGLVTRP